MIWLGQLELLRALGVKVAGIDVPRAIDRHMFARFPADAAVILTGGGSFGDLWTDTHEHRERVIEAAAGRPVVQMPQSLCFRDEANVKFTQDVLARHGNVVLTWRDAPSYEAALKYFPDSRSVLTPDVAFALRAERPAGPPAMPVLCISRTDQEGGDLAAVRVPNGRHVDWSWHGSVRTRIGREPVWSLLSLERRIGPFLSDPIRQAMCKHAARVTIEQARLLVSSAAVVVSDRLHAHVLCTMLGIPHVMIDTRYGKVTDFVGTWTADCDLVKIASSPKDAVKMANCLAGYFSDRGVERRIG